MEFGPLLIRWTVRLSLALYAAFGVVSLASRGKPRSPWTRWLWTGASAAFVAHVLAVFHFHHHWSHAAALHHTAVRTGQMLGWEFGGGIFFSYFFTALWAADAAWWNLAATSYERRPRWLSRTIHGYLAFIAFQGAIVFEAGITRWAGLAACLVLAGLALRDRLPLRTRSAPESTQESTSRERSLAC